MPPAEFPRAQAIERRLLCSCPFMGREPCASSPHIPIPRRFTIISRRRCCPLISLCCDRTYGLWYCLGQDIERPNRRIEFVCFVKTGIASVVAV